MSNRTLLIKGAIRHDDDVAEVLTLKVSRYDPYGYSEECSIFEVNFQDDKGTKTLSLEFVNLYETCYLRDINYIEKEWSDNGLLMAISVSFHLTKFERFIIIGNYLFETITRIFSKNSIYPEIVLKESEYNKNSSYYINYLPRDIIVKHNDDVFGIIPEDTILDSALENNIELKHMCKAGICMKCRKKFSQEPAWLFLQMKKIIWLSLNTY
ncbi:hypothetical protein AN414_02785 [Serratia marcescens]|nr:hypothetical protein AN414_02785 [Serratia marcescens]